MSQLSFATLDHRNEKKQTKRERFLSEMDAVVPWARLLGLIEPHYPKAGKGRRPYPLDVMLRIYFPPAMVPVVRSRRRRGALRHPVDAGFRWTGTWS
jgi:hypothetical protein